jgi:hypothetical protein
VVLATAAGCATRTIKPAIGTARQQRDRSRPRSLRHPSTRSQAASFGIGGGWNQDEMENHGTVRQPFQKDAREHEAMKEIWTKPKAEYHGEFVISTR